VEGGPIGRGFSAPTEEPITMNTSSTEDLRDRQRDAIWKWRWLGLRESTPAFKASVVLLALAAIALAVSVAGLFRF